MTDVPTVHFSRTGKSVTWDPSAETLLDFAEKNGLELDFGCRAGTCGDCSARILSGSVTYLWEPDVTPEPEECLTCCSAPETDLTLDL